LKGHGFSRAYHNHKNICGLQPPRDVFSNCPTTRFRPVPSCAPIRIEGRIVKHEGRKFWAESSILNDHHTRLAHSSGIFIEIKPKAS